MVNGWLSEPATIQFNFLHRFTESGAPEHQISNSPTFHAETIKRRESGLTLICSTT